jgi:morphogenetic protein associated with SpoVID
VKIHIVKRGDTLYKLSQKYHVDLDTLIQMNPHIENPDQIDVGMKVKIPTPTQFAAMSPEFIKHKHTVEQGDSLWKLSKAWNVPLQAMIKANPQLKSPHALLTGEVVNIPDMEKLEAPSQAPAAHDVNTPMNVPSELSQADVEKPGVQAEQLPASGVSPMDVHVPMEQQEEELFQQFQIPATEAFSWNPEDENQAPPTKTSKTSVADASYEYKAPSNSASPDFGLPGIEQFLQQNVFGHMDTNINASANVDASMQANAHMYGHVNPYAQAYGLPGAQQGFEPDLASPYINQQMGAPSYMPNPYNAYGMQQMPYPYLPQAYGTPEYGMPGVGFPEGAFPANYAPYNPWNAPQQGDCGCGGHHPKPRSQERYALSRQLRTEVESSWDDTIEEEGLGTPSATKTAKKKAKVQVKSQKKKAVKSMSPSRRGPWINV